MRVILLLIFLLPLFETQFNESLSETEDSAEYMSRRTMIGKRIKKDHVANKDNIRHGRKTTRRPKGYDAADADYRVPGVLERNIVDPKTGKIRKVKLKANQKGNNPKQVSTETTNLLEAKFSPDEKSRTRVCILNAYQEYCVGQEYRP